jgi:hypothetical protein
MRFNDDKLGLRTEGTLPYRNPTPNGTGKTILHLLHCPPTRLI